MLSSLRPKNAPKNLSFLRIQIHLNLYFIVHVIMEWIEPNECNFYISAKYSFFVYKHFCFPILKFHGVMLRKIDWILRSYGVAVLHYVSVAVQLRTCSSNINAQRKLQEILQNTFKKTTSYTSYRRPFLLSPPLS